MADSRIRVLLTGAAGQIGYALVFRIASGEVFGDKTAIDLSLLELESALAPLKGVVMELEDCAFPLLRSVVATTDSKTAFKDVDWALLVGSIPRKTGMERGDLLKVNGGIFTTQGKALSDYAKPTCKVLVVGNPCNTNAYIAKASAPRIPARNFFAMTMLDQNRACAQLALKTGCSVAAVKNMAIWGNHSATQFPDFYHATIAGKSVTQCIADESWLKTVFMETVQRRGAEVIAARGLSSAASAANAIIETLRYLTTPTPANTFFSVAVSSDGSYGIEPGLMFSYPVRLNGTAWEIVPGIKHNAFAQERIQITHKELLAEKEIVKKLF